MTDQFIEGVEAVGAIPYEENTTAAKTLVLRVIKHLNAKYPRELSKKKRGWALTHSMMPQVHIGELAKDVGITTSGMSLILYGRVKTPSIAVGVGLAKAMGIEVGQVQTVLRELARLGAIKGRVVKPTGTVRPSQKKGGTKPMKPKKGKPVAPASKSMGKGGKKKC